MSWCFVVLFCHPVLGYVPFTIRHHGFKPWGHFLLILILKKFLKLPEPLLFYKIIQIKPYIVDVKINPRVIKGEINLWCESFKKYRYEIFRRADSIPNRWRDGEELEMCECRENTLQLGCWESIRNWWKQWLPQSSC
jgi:hypothetical protein